jgi:heme oxygenase
MNATQVRPRILMEIKQQTRPQHDSVETNRYGTAMMDGSMSREMYLSFLKKFYGFHLAMESELENFAWSEYGINFDQRRKISLLKQDFHALGMNNAEIDALPICKDMPEMQTMEQALGALYVMEGSTLGGQIQARQLKKIFDFEPENGAAYFSSYGANVGVMWKDFCMALVQGANNDEEKEIIIIRAAQETFAALERWLALA